MSPTRLYQTHLGPTGCKMCTDKTAKLPGSLFCLSLLRRLVIVDWPREMGNGSCMLDTVHTLLWNTLDSLRVRYS